MHDGVELARLGRLDLDRDEVSEISGSARRMQELSHLFVPLNYKDRCHALTVGDLGMELAG